MTTHIDVDFNGIEADGHLTALIDHAHGLVEPGALVILQDADGNRCQARVLSVVNRIITLEINWPTWNHVNTLMDALEESLERVRGDVESLDRAFDRSPTAIDRKAEFTKT